MDTLTIGADTWFTLNDKLLSFQETNENLDANAHECNSDSAIPNTLKVTPAAPRDSIQIFVEDELLRSAYAGYWEWRPPLGFAGLCKLRVEVPGYSVQVARVRVLPEKLSQEHYEIMLADLSTITVDLLIRLNSWISEKAILQLRSQESSPLRDYRLMKELMSQMESAMFHIRRYPHRMLQKQDKQMLVYDIYHYSSETRPEPSSVLPLPARITAVSGLSRIPQVWTVLQDTLTYDVYENRLLRQFIQHQLATKIHFIQHRAKSDLERLNKDYVIAITRHWRSAPQLQTEIMKLNMVVADCERMMHQCVAWLGEPFLKTVKTSDIPGKATQILLKNPFYNQFFQVYLHFQEELTIDLDARHFLTDLAMHKVSEMYEVWSVFEITEIVLDMLEEAGYIPASSTLFYEVERNHFQFKVRKNEPSIVFTKGELRVEIKYEPIYPSNLESSIANIPALVADASSQRTPDLAIEVYRFDKPISVIIFDAKYKWQEVNGHLGPKSQDKNTMREYKDIICYRPDPGKPSKLQHIVSNAYILYPGDTSWQEPNNKVGAIPLVPNMDSQKKAYTEKTIKDLLRMAHVL